MCVRMSICHVCKGGSYSAIKARFVLNAIDRVLVSGQFVSLLIYITIIRVEANPTLQNTYWSR